jgi:PAS domain S-box-containing protein
MSITADAYDLVQTTLLGEAADSAPIGIFVADDEMRYVAVNRFCCELLGYERSELLRLKVSDVSPAPVSLEQWDDMLRRGSLHGETRLVRKDGTEVVADFDAVTTRVANMLVYVAFVRPRAE